MQLNTLRPAPGSKPTAKRVGRGIGSGLGKTCGSGHKGQKARSGGSVRPGFEGGQMPLQRRLPKFGFNSRLAKVTDEVRLDEINKLAVDMIDLEALKAAGLVANTIQRVRVINSGKIEKSVTINGLTLTQGAREAITAAGGKVVD